MLQGEYEPIQSYLARLRATALDCNYMCPACEHDLSDMYINKGTPKNQSIKAMIFSDSSAAICLGGPKHLEKIGLSLNNPIPSRKIVRAAGGFTLTCQGWLPVEFTIKQRLYFCKAGCIDVGILPVNFPNPIVISPTYIAGIDDITKPDTSRDQLPDRPHKIPFPPT